MASGRLVDYLGHGNIADRPAAPTLTTDAIGFWYSDDTNELSLWDGVNWQENITAGGGGGGTTTDWANTTTTISGTTSDPTKGTIVRDKIYWRRVGDSMEIRVDYEQSVAGAAGSGDYMILIPDGKTIDATKIDFNTSASPRPIVGQGNVTDNATFSVTTWVTARDTTHLRMRDNAVGYIGSTNRALSTTNMMFSFIATVPIAEWA